MQWMLLITFAPHSYMSYMYVIYISLQTLCALMWPIQSQANRQIIHRTIQFLVHLNKKKRVSHLMSMAKENVQRRREHCANLYSVLAFESNTMEITYKSLFCVTVDIILMLWGHLFHHFLLFFSFFLSVGVCVCVCTHAHLTYTYSILCRFWNDKIYQKLAKHTELCTFVILEMAVQMH